MAQEQPGGVLRIRSLPPTLRQRVYVPARVRDLILRCLAADITLIHAPAGYGKTSVVLQTLLDQGIEPYWHTCAQDDREPGLFLSGIVWALGRARSATGAAALASLAAGDARRVFAAALQPLLNELAEGMAGDRVVVIDDADHVAASSASLEMLDYLFRHLPPALHLLVLSRSRIPLPSLSRAVASGHAEEIDGDFLLLREDDIGPCMREAYGTDITDEEAARLFTITSGWGVALRLANRLREMQRDLSWDQIRGALTGERGTLFEYLASEVLERLDPETDRFLRRTAVLETLDPELCGALTGVERAAELIQKLGRAGLPVLKIGWNSYRCHSLLREHILGSMSEEERRHLHDRAGAACAAVGRWPEALAHYAQAGDIEAALGVVGERGDELFRAGYGAALRDVARAAPPEIARSHYRALRWAAFAAFRAGEWDWALEALRDAEAGARACGDEQEALATVEAAARAFTVLGRFAEGREAALRMLELIPDEQRAQRAAATVAHLLPATTGLGRFHDAMRMLDDTLPGLDQQPPPSADMEAQARPVAAITLARAGDFAGARAQLARADAVASACADPTARSLPSWIRGIVEFLAGDLEAAGAAAAAAASIAVPLGDLDRQAECRALQASIETMRGNIADARSSFAAAASITHGAPAFWVTSLSLLARPRFLFDDGDLSGMLAAADANQKLAAATGETWFACLASLDLAHAHLLAGDVASAVAQVDLALPETDELESDLLRWCALLLRAAAQPDNTSSLARALGLAEARDYRHLPVYWPRRAQVWAAVARGLRTGQYLRAEIILAGGGPAAATAVADIAQDGDPAVRLRAVRVLASLGTAARERLRSLGHDGDVDVAAAARAALGASHDERPYGLSERETEVLALIVRGGRTRDIAEQLVVTPSTVSTHIEHIMAKTGTGSRAELVSLAVREGLAAGPDA